MTLIAVVGAITLLLSTLAKLAGLIQGRNNESGQARWSWEREAVMAASYGSWLAYGLLLGNGVMSTSGALGLELSVLLLWQATRTITPTGDPS